MTSVVSGERRRTERPSLRVLIGHPGAWTFLLLVITLGVFTLLNVRFLSLLNISGMLALAPEEGLLALGMTMLLTAGQFDLSVGSVFGFVPLMMFLLVNEQGMSLAVAALIGLVIGALIGLVNGVLVVKGGVSSFLVTLSMQLIVYGGALYISSGFPQSTLTHASWVDSAVAGTLTFGQLTLKAGLAWFVAGAVLLWYLLRQTPTGNWITATGGNADAARARGIRTDWITVGLFMLSGTMAGLAGIISDVRVGSAFPDAGQGYELYAFAMAVIGGTSLFGGYGSIGGTVLGVALVVGIQNGVILLGAPGLAYDLFVGAIILVAMLLQTMLGGTVGRRRRAS